MIVNRKGQISFFFLQTSGVPPSILYYQSLGWTESTGKGKTAGSKAENRMVGLEESTS